MTPPHQPSTPSKRLALTRLALTLLAVTVTALLARPTFLAHTQAHPAPSCHPERRDCALGNRVVEGPRSVSHPPYTSPLFNQQITYSQSSVASPTKSSRITTSIPDSNRHAFSRAIIAHLGLAASAAEAALSSIRHSLLPTPVHAAQNPTPQPNPELTNPDIACASCHRKIYKQYEDTPMAQGSGAAIAGLIPGSFHQPLAGIDYTIFERNTSAWMSYTRSPLSPKGPLSGTLNLRYFIGSGTQSRTYLYTINHQWFELPINFYAQRNGYEMAPAFAKATRMPAPLPTDPNCLHCHATNIQPAEPTASNRYTGAPFLQGGIGCSACHGDPTAHLAQHGHGPIANPDNFAPMQRDSACIQCHLEGDAVVYRPGRSLAQFVPGDNLSDIAVYFVKASQSTGGNRAVSQYEALLQSACKRSSGDKLTCTTCHANQN